MNEVIYFVGCLGVFLIALLCGYGLFEFTWAIACSVSFHRWRFAMAKKDGRRLVWSKVPYSFARVTIDMIGHRNGSATYSSEGGAVWKGIGDWGTGFRGQK